MTAKQQFNIYLPPELIRQIKHRAIDEDLSLSVLVEQILSAYLADDEEPIMEATLSTLPIVYVSNMQRALQFYQALGFAVHHAGATWSELRVGNTAVALHTAEDVAKGVLRVSLSLVAHTKLETLIEQLTANGLTITTDIADEAFGRSLTIYDPDGLPIQINEHDPDLYA